MFCGVIVHKLDIVTIHSRLLYTIPRIASIGLLVTTNSITSFVAQLSVKGFLIYRHLEKFYTAISSVTDLSNKFMDWNCFENEWCLMDAFRLNYFTQSRQVHSNNRWHKFHGSIRKLFVCMDHNLTWLYLSSVNEVFDAYAIHWTFAMVSLIAEPTQWLIQEHGFC